MDSMQISSMSSRERPRWYKALAFSKALVVVHAGLACFAAACAAVTQSGREGTSDAAVLNASPTTVRVVLAEDDARRLVSLDKTVSEAREEGRFADAIAPGRKRWQSGSRRWVRMTRLSRTVTRVLRRLSRLSDGLRRPSRCGARRSRSS